MNTLGSGFIGVRVTRSLVLCVCLVDRCLSFSPFCFGHCVVCSSSIYRFWLPLWYLQTLLTFVVGILLYSSYVDLCLSYNILTLLLNIYDKKASKYQLYSVYDKNATNCQSRLVYALILEYPSTAQLKDMTLNSQFLLIDSKETYKAKLYAKVKQ